MLITTTNKKCVKKVSNYFNDHEVVKMHFKRNAFDCDQDIVICDEENYEDDYHCALFFLVCNCQTKINQYSDNVIPFFPPYNPLIIDYEIIKLLRRRPNDIVNILRDLGIATHLEGYSFIKEAICLYKRNKTIGEIYNCLAKRYKCSPSNVERLIRYTIEKSWLSADLNLCDELFGNTIDFEKAKPTNKQFIDRLSEFL